MRLSPADIKSLQVFRVVVEHGGFVGAQMALGLTQSAVSFHIKALEDRVGFRLCHRGRAGFSLTERGELVHERAKALFAALSDFESALGELRHTITGTLRLGVIDNTISDPDLSLHKVVRAFLHQAPKARLEISIGVPDQLVRDVHSRGLDIAIIPEIPKQPGLHFTRFYEERHLLYAAADHVIWTSQPVTQDAVLRYPFVIRPYASQTELEYFPEAPVGATASNMEAQAMFILSSRFLGYLPDHYAKRWCDLGLMMPVLADSCAIRSPFVVVTRVSTHRSLLMRTFIRELVASSWARAHLDEAL